MYQNLQDDANVCPDFRRRFYDYVLGAQAVTSPAEAGTLYPAFLQDLNSEIPACLRPENRENQIAAPSVTGLARVVDGDAFIKYSLFAGNKRRVPRRYRSARSIQTKTRLKEIQKGTGPQFLSG